MTNKRYSDTLRIRTEFYIQVNTYLNMFILFISNVTKSEFFLIINQ